MKSRDASVERENFDGCPGSSTEEFPRPLFTRFHKEAVIALPSRLFFSLPPPPPLP